MNKKLLFFSLLSALAATATAQSLKEGYVEWPKSSGLAGYVTDWKAGNLNMEDENFFISRVKPKVRFRNAATQVNTSLNANNDKRLCFWVPVTTSLEGEYNLNALPNSNFDSEVFSVWSYVDVYGNWTSPHGWVPGNFADVAHKNGVSVSGVASIPYGGINSEWNTALQEQIKLNGQDVADFLYYHGVDGLGYNSEFSAYGLSLTDLAKQHGDIIKGLTEKGNPIAENLWYDGTTTSGGIQFDAGLGSHNIGNYADNGQRRSSLFFNYNWNTASLLQRSVTNSENAGVSSLYLYAGMNMQGGEPRSGESYPVLANYPISLGYWGAHQYNMFFLNRTAKGSSPTTIQNTYLYDTERFFTNGAQNPAVDFEVFTQRNHYPSNKFFGTSKFMTARSSLSWNLSEEPFVTFFNIGNGQFFNWNGERVSDQSWYNIGLQDYMPTWRYWWAGELLGRNVEAGSIGMKSTFVWDDAFFGGSCFQLSGTESDAWLHLFKTNFGLLRNDVITVSYKHLAGTGKVSVVFTLEGAEGTPVTDESLTLDLTGAPNADEWITKEITLTRGSSLATALNGKNVALIALHVEGAEDLVVDLGQFSIKRGTAATPAAPEVTKASMLANHYKGVDGKLIWNMASNKAAGEPVYNLDVNTSLFKLYAREEGGDPVFVGATTSWAGLIFCAPFSPESTAKVQLGVSAVSTDFASESEISWSEPLARTEYTVSNEITLNKPVIKPLEGFEIKYVDPMHAPSTWTIYNSKNEKMAGATGTSLVIADGEGLNEVGGYDLVIDEGTASERRFGYYVQVSSEAVGAMPEIYTVSINGDEVKSDDAAIDLKIVEGAEATEALTVSYTGRDADGSASRGLQLMERFFGCKVGDLGLQAGQSFSVAFWVKYDAIPSKPWALLDITNRGGSWPVSNWGYCWLRGNSEGKVEDYVFRGNSTDGTAPYEYKYKFSDDTKFQANSWTHVVFTFDYENANSFRSKLYMNGVLQQATFSRNGVQKGTQEDYDAKNYGINATDWLSTGGLPYQGLAVSGILDDFQIWNKAVTPEEVKQSMAGLDANNLPADVLCFWDFEEDAQEDNSFVSKGSKPGVKAYSYDCIGGDDAQEGQGLQTPFNPTYSSGCPFLIGTAFPVVTTPSWSAKHATITDAKGTGTDGSAKVSFATEGDYTLTLTLANSYGEDKVNYPVFKVSKESDGINAVETAEPVEVHTDANGVFVEFPGEGRYVVAVYDVRGMLVAQRADEVAAGNLMHVAIHNPGAYLVRVASENGQVLRTVKVIKH